MTFEVAIPSYERPEQIHDLTIRTLHDGGIGSEHVTVFLADAEQRAKYEAAAPAGFRGRWAVAEPGIRAARNVIHGHYPQGTRVMVVDDDIRRVYQKRERKRQIDLARLADVTFRYLEATGLHLGGIYPIDNPLYMRENWTTSLGSIMGHLYFIRSRPGALPALTFEEYEDMEFVILNYLADGGVLRRNDIAAITRTRQEPGGLQTDRDARNERHRTIPYEIAARWPHLVYVREDGFEGKPEAVIRKQRSKA